eukprot:6200981-Prymnesium_polylepis.1
MEADHPAERLRVRVAACRIAACSSNVYAPRGRRLNAALKADHPPRDRRPASGAQAQQAPAVCGGVR